MKQLLFTLTLLMMTSSMKAQTSDADTIRNVIETSFLNGALNEMNTDKMQEGFHSDFSILIANGSELFRLTLPMWVAAVEKYKSSPELMASGERVVEHTYELVGITGNAAIAKVELIRQGTKITTDYLSLLRFPAGWKVVSKVSNEHVTHVFTL